jgi:phosphohistidine phosphatase
MKSIFFLRHSFAEFNYGEPDFERKITKEGYRKLDTQIQALNQFDDISIDLTWCSPATRTQQTLSYLEKSLDLKSDIQLKEWIYKGYTTQDFLNELAKIPNQIDKLLLVGHNPDISLLASKLCNKNSLIEFQPASLLKINFAEENWSKIEVFSGQIDFFLQ